MNVRLLSIKFLLLSVCIVCSANDDVTPYADSIDRECLEIDTVAVVSGDSINLSDAESKPSYEKRVARLRRGWNRIIPNLTMLQYAGDIGMISTGFGWDYGKHNQWETYAIFGFVPKNHTNDAMWTFTLKEIYTPWSLKLYKNLHVCPVFVTLMVNTTMSSEFWTREPERYPQGYYGFSSRIRFHIGFGQKIKLTNLQKHWRVCKDLSLYYEISSCDLYIRQKFLCHSIPLKDIICLGVGVQYTIF